MRVPLDELFRRAIDVVEGAGIPYLVYGGIAFPFWGRAATTDEATAKFEIPGTLERMLKEQGL